jgi:hypothetical protein
LGDDRIGARIPSLGRDSVSAALRRGRLGRDPDIVARRVADECILVPIRRRSEDVESIYTLNEVAAFVWELLDGQRRFDDLRDAVVAEFEVERDQAESDLAAFLEQLQRSGALRVS